MPIQRLKKFNNFTAIPNATVTAIGQSDALAIWVYLMTKPDDWVIRRADILNNLSIGRDRYEKAVARLSELGLWEIEVSRDARGRLSGRTINLLDTPKCRKTRTSGNQHQGDENTPLSEAESADSPKCGKTEMSETPNLGKTHHLLNNNLLPKNDLTNPASDDAARTPPPEVYKTKRGQKLAGRQLEWFEQFWETFGYKNGKAEAADAWLDLKVTECLLEEIISGAEREAAARPTLLAAGRTPKMGQGWLSGRRWEDQVQTSTAREPFRLNLAGAL